MTYESTFLAAAPRLLPGRAVNPGYHRLEVKECEFAVIIKAPLCLTRSLLKPRWPHAPCLDYKVNLTVVDWQNIIQADYFTR